MEVHDNLSVLTNYGAVSSAAAAFTGCYVYDELKDFNFEQRATVVVVVAVHCWGLRALGQRVPKAAGKKDDSAVAEDRSSITAGTPEKPLGGGRRGGGGTGSSGSGGFAEGEKVGRQAVEMTGISVVPSNGGKEAVPDGPLLPFNEPRSIDEDAQMEEKLFARALAPQRLAPAISGFPLPDATSSPGTDEVFVGGFGAPSGFGSPSAFDDAAAAAAAAQGETPQFDADFEEIMRRFDEDDRHNEEVGPGVMPIVELSPEFLSGDGLPPPPPLAVSEQVMAEQVLQFDAQTLLDDTGNDDEDELLRIIEDIPGPCDEL